MKRYFFLFILFLFIAPSIAHARAVALPVSTLNPLNKRIDIDISEQQLRYYEGDRIIGHILISSARKGYWTPRGTFAVQIKRPAVLYQGFNPDGTRSYYYPNTKWNMQIIPHYYIHGAFWHNNFGVPMSHGCVNVSYKDMEGLYNWADVGTPIFIHE